MPVVWSIGGTVGYVLSLINPTMSEQSADLSWAAFWQSRKIDGLSCSAIHSGIITHTSYLAQSRRHSLCSRSSLPVAS